MLTNVFSYLLYLLTEGVDGELIEELMTSEGKHAFMNAQFIP